MIFPVTRAANAATDTPQLRIASVNNDSAEGVLDGILRQGKFVASLEKAPGTQYLLFDLDDWHASRRFLVEISQIGDRYSLIEKVRLMNNGYDFPKNSNDFVVPISRELVRKSINDSKMAQAFHDRSQTDTSTRDTVMRALAAK